MDLVVYDDEDQRYVPLLVALCAALLTGLVVAGVAFSLARTPPAESLGEVTPPQAAVQEQEPTCTPALERADAALEIANRLEGALREQTSVMDDLLATGVTTDQALDRALVPLTAAAKDRQAFVDALAGYQQARADCQQ